MSVGTRVVVSPSARLDPLGELTEALPKLDRAELGDGTEGESSLLSSVAPDDPPDELAPEEAETGASGVDSSVVGAASTGESAASVEVPVTPDFACVSVIDQSS